MLQQNLTYYVIWVNDSFHKYVSVVNTYLCFCLVYLVQKRKEWQISQRRSVLFPLILVLIKTAFISKKRSSLEIAKEVMTKNNTKKDLIK